MIKNTNTIIDLTITMISYCHDDLEPVEITDIEDNEIYL